MALKQFNPTSPGRRFMTSLTFDEITKTKPEKSLTEPKSRTGGRTTAGRITVRLPRRRPQAALPHHRLPPRQDGDPAKVTAIEYDPNRSARIALIHYADGEKRYILWPEGLKVGQTRDRGRRRDILPGNCLPLKPSPPAP